MRAGGMITDMASSVMCCNAPHLSRHRPCSRSTHAMSAGSSIIVRQVTPSMSACSMKSSTDILGQIPSTTLGSMYISMVGTRSGMRPSRAHKTRSCPVMAMGLSPRTPSMGYVSGAGEGRLTPAGLSPAGTGGSPCPWSSCSGGLGAAVACGRWWRHPEG